MLRDLLEESSLKNKFKKILSIGHSRSNKDLEISQSLLLNTKENPRNSTLKKYLLWY